MTPSVPGKAYLIAENHRHRAASSSSVNSYLAGCPPTPCTAFRAARRGSGKGTTFVFPGRLSTWPPLAAARIAAGSDPLLVGENTIERGFRVNQPAALRRLFTSGVLFGQQWQKGDNYETAGSVGGANGPLPPARRRC